MDERKQLFLAALRRTGRVAEAARSSKLGRRTAYRLREKDPDFVKAWQDALCFTPSPASDGQESPRWGAQVLALVDDGQPYEQAVEVVAEHAIAEARRDANAVRAYLEERARGCA